METAINIEYNPRNRGSESLLFEGALRSAQKTKLSPVSQILNHKNEGTSMVNTSKALKMSVETLRKICKKNGCNL